MLESIQKKLYLEATRFELYTLLRYLLVKSTKWFEHVPATRAKC